jgi:hypothetical protein
VIGCARCCVGDRGGLDEIKLSIQVADAAGSLDMLEAGYTNLSSELHFLGRLGEAHQAHRQFVDLAERYGHHRFQRTARAEAAGWAYLAGRWDEALAIADEAAARVERGDTHFTDAISLSLRGWIRLARGDSAGAGRDTERAVELARASDLQAQVAAYPRGTVALVTGARDEAEELASVLAAIGPPMVGALCIAFPTLTDVAWLFRDLGREREFREAVLEPDPIKSPWNEAARAICDGQLARAAEMIEGIGHTAAAAYARLRAAEALAADEQGPLAAAQLEQAESFYRRAHATRFLGELDRLPDTSAGFV